jgi:hypothetical protein
MQRIERLVQRPVESLHVGEAIGCFQIEGLHQPRIVVDRGFSFVAQLAHGKRGERHAQRIARLKRQRFFARFERALGIARTQKRFGEIAPRRRIVRFAADCALVRGNGAFDIAQPDERAAEPIMTDNGVAAYGIAFFEAGPGFLEAFGAELRNSSLRSRR